MCRKCGDNPGRDPPKVQAPAGAQHNKQINAEAAVPVEVQAVDGKADQNICQAHAHANPNDAFSSSSQTS